jgi:hypothetical protein
VEQSHPQSNTRKKQCQAVTNGTVKLTQLDMGMFWLLNPKIRMSKIFPQELPQKVCILFCFRGKKCKRILETACPFLHPCSPEGLKHETIKIIGNHFMTKKIGWFNEYHFLKVACLKPKYKTLLGGKDGPSSKMARPIFDIVVQQETSQPICLLYLFVLHIF